MIKCTPNRKHRSVTPTVLFQRKRGRAEDRGKSQQLQSTPFSATALHTDIIMKNKGPTRAAWTFNNVNQNSQVQLVQQKLFGSANICEPFFHMFSYIILSIYGGFLKCGHPQIMYFHGIFHEINHPAIGVSPFMELLGQAAAGAGAGGAGGGWPEAWHSYTFLKHFHLVKIRYMCIYTCVFRDIH